MNEVKQHKESQMLNKLNKKGFTMVELLVVLVIVAILAAVATPIYLANTQRARASEAIATMGLLRQAMRDYRVNANTYYDIAAATDVGNIQNAIPISVTLATGAPNPATAGAVVDVGTAQYFSNGSFTIDSGGNTGVPADADGSSGLFADPPAQDFVIRASGKSTGLTAPFGRNHPCATGDVGNCSAKGGEVENYRIEMDNSGRTFISYDGGTTWAAY
jgi:prepilin-type N-terminal cleavage/methylation domain-containing protein